MYINLENLFRINPLMIPLLLVLKHASKKDVSEKIALIIYDDVELEKLENEGYIKYNKEKKKNECPFTRMRLTPKSTKLLNSLQDPDVLDEDVQIFNWLSRTYKSRGKEIGNGKRTQRLIASFREKSEIEKNHLAFLCQTFINDDDQQDWSHRLEYVFYKPKSAFQTRFVLEDSRLYGYYIKRKEYFDNKFKTIKNGI